MQRLRIERREHRFLIHDPARAKFRIVAGFRIRRSRAPFTSFRVSSFNSTVGDDVRAREQGIESSDSACSTLDGASARAARGVRIVAQALHAEGQRRVRHLDRRSPPCPRPRAYAPAARTPRRLSLPLHRLLDRPHHHYKPLCNAAPRFRRPGRDSPAPAPSPHWYWRREVFEYRNAAPAHFLHRDVVDARSRRGRWRFRPMPKL